MRFQILAMVLMAAAATPAVAQQGEQASERLDRRLGKLEQEMRAVQRRVFPAGNIEPEIRSESEAAPLPGVPASDATADLTARIDALEAQLASLTGQIEQNQNQIRRLEQALTSLRESAGSRDTTEQPGPPATAVPTPPASASPSAAATVPTPPNTVDEAEEAYNAGFRLWEQKRFAEAQQALQAVAKQFPKHPKASWAQNLAGRAYLDDGKPATAAKILLANYQGNPRGERAADSLYFLGQALVKLQKPAEACKVYDELQDVYGTNMRDFLKQRLPQARAAAKCD